MEALDERRIATRFPVDIFNIRGFIQPVQGFSDIITPTGTPMDFHMVDFSAEGYRVQVYEPIKAGTKILINFQGIGEWGDFLDVNEEEFEALGHILREGNDINCLGVVKWREGMNAAKGFQIGIHLREECLQHKFHSYFRSIIN